MKDFLTVQDAARAAVTAAAGGPAIAIVALLDGPHAGARMLLDAAGTASGTLGGAALDKAGAALARAVLAEGSPRTETVELSGHCYTLYVESHRPPERLVIVGAGHIAVPLATLGVDLGFRVTVLDDREAFTAADRFPSSAEVLRRDFAADPFADIAIDEETYIALVTRGHRWDYDCLRRLFERPDRPRYLGMIGSRRRVRAAFQALLRAGVPRAELAAIHAPIGIDIGAETPAEIAVSIAAEMIATRHGATADELNRHERVLERLLPEELATDG